MRWDPDEVRDDERSGGTDHGGNLSPVEYVLTGCRRPNWTREWL